MNLSVLSFGSRVNFLKQHRYNKVRKYSRVFIDPNVGFSLFWFVPMFMLLTAMGGCGKRQVMLLVN